jgi:hypothetical protein
MDYASSYAIGGHLAAPAVALPAPKPHRMHWSTLVLCGGIAVCAVALLATVAGIPARLAYDVDGPADRNKPSSMDPAKIQQSLDGNMKWIDENSSDAEGSYVGLIKSINRNEAAIPAMASALVQMNASVEAIDKGLGALGESTTKMGDDIDAMATTSAASAATMTGLGSDIGFLSRTMVELADATGVLSAKMAGIEQKAGGIADGGTSAALGSAKDLNAALPDGIPAARTTDGEDYATAMKRLAEGVEGGGAGEAATVRGPEATYQ